MIRNFGKFLPDTLFQNCIHEEIKSRLNSGNACCDSVQNLLCYRLISKDIKIKIHRIKILPVVLYGCETWSLRAREKYKIRVFGKRVDLKGTRFKVTAQ